MLKDHFVHDELALSILAADTQVPLRHLIIDPVESSGNSSRSVRLCETNAFIILSSGGW